LLSNAEKRAVRNSEPEIVPRISDLHALVASTSGKIEVEYMGEDKGGDELIDRLFNRAVLKVWDHYLKIDDLKGIVTYFAEGGGVAVSDMMPAEEYLEGLRAMPDLQKPMAIFGGVESPAFI